MKKTTLIVAAAIFITGAFVISCQSKTEKVKNAELEVKNAETDLANAKKDAAEEKIANAEDWNAFKAKTEANIQNNEVKIAGLKNKMDKSGLLLDVVYANRIEVIEQNNKNMRIRLMTYEKNRSDWEKFKREFNHDMAEIGESLTALTVDTEK